MRDINFEEANMNTGTTQWADTSSNSGEAEVTDMDELNKEESQDTEIPSDTEESDEDSDIDEDDEAEE
jgi:hypothetical protein